MSNKEARPIIIFLLLGAQGEYAYCKVIKELVRSKALHFRVLALSATPGTDVNAVKCVIQNLLISKIELRHEESPDILPFTHQVPLNLLAKRS